jgi:alpha-D-xyloside xylohydrolase
MKRSPDPTRGDVGQIIPASQFTQLDGKAPIEIIPLYVRAGCLLPLGPEMQYATEKPDDPVELRIYPGEDGEFVLYEDENDNYDYEKGVCATIPLGWKDAKKTIIIGDRKGSFQGMLIGMMFA